tara:strand:- start:177 stop:1052 length:876 start_codon:yes stop_codon:yes gene_type:complete
MMDKFFYLIIEGMKNTWRHKVTALTAIFSLFILLYIIGIMNIAEKNSFKVLQYLRSKYKIEVFFSEDLSNEEAIGVIHKIKKIKGVKTATLIDKEDALRIFKDQFGESIIDLLGYNPLPASSVVNVDRNIRHTLKIEPIIKEIRSIQYVDEINYQGNLIRKIEGIYKKVADYIPYFLGIVIFIIGLIIYNMIKVSIYSRRETIKSLQLIGATKLFIKLPFIFEGMLISLISVSLVSPALILTSIGSNYLISNFTVYSLNLNIDPYLFLWLLFLVTLISILASYRAVSMFLK